MVAVTILTRYPCSPLQQCASFSSKELLGVPKGQRQGGRVERSDTKRGWGLTRAKPVGTAVKHGCGKASHDGLGLYM